MKTIICVIAVLATINLVTGELKASCVDDQSCGNKNEVCKGGECKCGVGFREGSEQNCVGVLGTPCEAEDDCEGFPGAICKDSKCHCTGGTLAGSRECVGVGKDDDECTQNSACINRVQPADNNKECRDKKCVCRASFHEGSDKRCKATKNLHDMCEIADDCFQADSQNNNALECASNSEGQFCQCKKGYKEEGDRCNGSAAKFVLSASSLLFVAMAILKM